MIFSPLEQFSILRFIPLGIGPFDISFTNSAFFCFLAIGFFLLLCTITTDQGGKINPSHWQLVVESVYSFVVSMVHGQLGYQGNRYLPMLFTLFCFLASVNLIGMIPYAFTGTSHLAVTISFSFSFFLGVTFIGFYRHGLHFFSLFFPPGAPLALAPLLVVLEIVSYSFRGISLGVRLFANMIAGHTLVKILCGFSWAILGRGFLLSLGSVLPFGVVVALTGLEFMVGALQAYVFCVLLCIYLNDAENLHLHLKRCLL